VCVRESICIRVCVCVCVCVCLCERDRGGVYLDMQDMCRAVKWLNCRWLNTQVTYYIMSVCVCVRVFYVRVCARAWEGECCWIRKTCVSRELQVPYHVNVCVCECVCGRERVRDNTCIRILSDSLSLTHTLIMQRRAQRAELVSRCLVRSCKCGCVCVCVWERERDGIVGYARQMQRGKWLNCLRLFRWYQCVCVYMCICVRVCVRACD